MSMRRWASSRGSVGHVSTALAWGLAVVMTSLVFGSCGGAGSTSSTTPTPDSARRADGLWRVDLSTDDGSPGSQQVCLDARVETLMTPFHVQFAEDICDPPVVKITARGFYVTRRCETGRGPVTYRGAGTGDLRSRYRLDATISLDLGETELPARMTVDARRLGNCGPEWSPGDVIFADGRTVNLLR